MPGDAPADSVTLPPAPVRLRVRRPGSEHGRLSAALVSIAALTTALAVAVAVAWRQLPPSAWLGALLAPAPGDVAELLFHYGLAPRLATTFLVGAGLALAGAIAQQVLDNPLAAPSTLGISAGAELALVAATLLHPGGLEAGREAVATAGALVAAIVVGSIAARHRFAPTTTVLGGLAVALFAGAFAAALKLMDQEEVGALYLWGAGSLAGTDPATVLFLLPRLAVLTVATALLARPIALLGLSEGSARSLGVTVAPIRIAALLVAVLIASSVTAAVGLVGFVELLAPALARAAGARRFGAVAFHATLIGGCLLVVVDAAAAWASGHWGVEVPTGALAAFVGAPALLVLVTRLKAEPFGVAAGGAPRSPTRRASLAPSPGLRFALIAAAVSLVVVLALAIGRTGEGWAIAGSSATLGVVSTYRLPRSLAALGAGALLGGAGTLLQRLTGNALVGPETLGLGAGAAAGLAVTLLVSAAPGPVTLMLAGDAGAVLVLALLAAAAARSHFGPERLLLAGVALGAVLQAALSLAMSLGDSRATRLLAFVSGSTVAVSFPEAMTVLTLALVLCPATLMLGRLLDVFTLGEASARSLGVRLGAARALVALVAALMTAAAVETVGPLSFVGLVGPQIALRLGFRGGLAQLGGSALVGAGAMVAADALGRIVAAPFEIPAGLVASAIGIPVFVVLLLRRES